MLYCYEANLPNTPLKCYGKTAYCRLLTDITYACFTIILPVVLMTIFGLMTISNMRQIQMRAKSSSIKESSNKETLLILIRQKQRRKKLESHLRRMLFLQVILLIFLTLPQAIHKLYFSLTSINDKTPSQYDLDRLLYKFELLLPYLESALPFYIYTLTGGKVFRQALKNLICCSK